MQSDGITVRRSRRDGAVTILMGSLVVTVVPGMSWFGTDSVTYQQARDARDEHAIGCVHGTVFIRQQDQPKAPVDPRQSRITRMRALRGDMREHGVSIPMLAKAASMSPYTVQAYLAEKNHASIGDQSYRRLVDALHALVA